MNPIEQNKINDMNWIRKTIINQINTHNMVQSECVENTIVREISKYSTEKEKVDECKMLDERPQVWRMIVANLQRRVYVHLYVYTIFLSFVIMTSHQCIYIYI